MDAYSGPLQGQLGDPEPGEQVGVSLYPYPPHDFECLYRHTCPYLDGLSTTWVLEEYRRAHDVYQEQLRIIDGFDGHSKARDKRIRMLERENALLAGLGKVPRLGLVVPS
jgi:hypothetical protein